ncbi:MAG: PRC-barrel domain-containing protein [Candidatus Thermoplasmatota archaeon]|nr:PRC-barrel domain-containing protein [Candidatus Thermoplasmatota archaeon]
MLTEITELYGRSVYNPQGVLIGEISDIIMDMDREDVYGLYLENPNSKIVENGAAISIPFRWIQAIGEIVILRRFPQAVKAPEEHGTYL